MLLALDQLSQQAAEVREMVVDDRAGDAGGPRDGLDRDAAVALLENHAERSVQQLLAALLGRHPRGVRTAWPRRSVVWP